MDDIIDRHMREMISHFNGDANKIGGHCLAIMHAVITMSLGGDEPRAADLIERSAKLWSEKIRATCRHLN